MSLNVYFKPPLPLSATVFGLLSVTSIVVAEHATSVKYHAKADFTERSLYKSSSAVAYLMPLQEAQ